MSLSRTTFSSLPSDIPPLILHHLDPLSLGRLSRVSRALYKLITKNDSLWRDSISSHYPELLRRNHFFWKDSSLSTLSPSRASLRMSPCKALQMGSRVSCQKIFDLFREFVEKTDDEPKKRFTCRLAHSGQLFLSCTMATGHSLNTMHFTSYLLLENSSVGKRKKAQWQKLPLICEQRQWLAPEADFIASCQIFYPNISKIETKKIKLFTQHCFELLKKKKNSIRELHCKKVVKTASIILLVMFIVYYIMFSISGRFLFKNKSNLDNVCHF